MFDSYDRCDDALLIAHFCAGDSQVWNILYDRHEEKLLRSIRRLMHRRRLEGYLPEDIAQEVWVSLLSGDCDRLKRYDPTRGSFNRYLERLAEQVIQQRQRTKSKRRKRVVPLKDNDPADPCADDGLAQAELAEYLEDLTPQESRYLRENLTGQPPQSAEPPISGGNERVLRHRLQRKWLEHFDTS